MQLTIVHSKLWWTNMGSSFSSSLDLDDTRGSRLTQQAMALAVD